jgi:uncharacterized membrane protein
MTAAHHPASSRGRARGLAILGLAVALGVATHLAVLWLMPRAIMHKAMVAVAGDHPPAAALPPMTDHTQRRIVMPSPDLLYATCVWDLSQRPLHIRANPQSPRYWSIALYASNTDNFHVINDRQAGGQPVDLLLLGPGQPVPAQLPSAATRTLRSPSDRGILLMRVLVGDYAVDREAVEAARATLRCEPA